jgi:hypothetical protein
LETLKGKLNPKLYNDLELFIVNNTDFTEKQKTKFFSLIERIHRETKEKIKG